MMMTTEIQSAISALENAANYLRNIDDREDKPHAIGLAAQAAEFAIEQLNLICGRRRAGSARRLVDR